MRISRKAEYALRALVALARHGRPLQIGELSRVENIPVKFLEQILLALRNDGLLASKRGVGGGYTLSVRREKFRWGRWCGRWMGRWRRCRARRWRAMMCHAPARTRGRARSGVS